MGYVLGDTIPERCEQHLLAPDSEPLTDCKGCRQSLPSEPVSFSGAAYRRTGEELLAGAEMTQSSPRMDDGSQKWNLGACYTAFMQLYRLESVSFRQLVLSESVSQFL